MATASFPIPCTSKYTGKCEIDGLGNVTISPTDLLYTSPDDKAEENPCVTMTRTDWEVFRNAVDALQRVMELA